MTYQDREPLQDRATEQAVLGAMLEEAEARKRVQDVLVEEDFSHPQLRLIFTRLLEMMTLGKVVDHVTVPAYLREVGELERAGGTSYLADLASQNPTAAAVLDYAATVKRLSKLRKIRAAGERLAYEAQATEADPDVLCSDMASELYRIGVSATDDLLDWGRQVGGRTMDEIEAQSANEGHLLGIDTGIPKLNEYMPGWISGYYYLIAARPSAGKSAFMLEQCLQAAKAGKRVMVFSLEMPATMLGRRYLAHEMPKDLSTIMEGRFYGDDFDRAHAVFAESYQYRLKVCENPSLTAAQIRARARTQAAKWGGVDLIAVDYVQLIESGRRDQNDNSRMSGISRELKLLARETNCALLALSQLSRRCEEERRWPRMADLRDSGSLEQDADAILFLHFPTWLVNGGKPDPECKAIRAWTESMRGVYLAKNRNGRRVMTALSWHGGYQAFGGLELDREEER